MIAGCLQVPGRIARVAVLVEHAGTGEPERCAADRGDRRARPQELSRLRGERTIAALAPTVIAGQDQHGARFGLELGDRHVQHDPHTAHGRDRLAGLGDGPHLETSRRALPLLAVDVRDRVAGFPVGHRVVDRQVHCLDAVHLRLLSSVTAACHNDSTLSIWNQAPRGQRIEQSRYEVERAEFGGGNPPGVHGIVASPQRPADDRTDEVVDLVDHGAWSVALDTSGMALDLDVQPRLLGDLAYARRCGRLAGLAAAPRNRPQARCRRRASLNHEQSSGIVKHNSAGAGHTFRSHGVSL